ncbi:DUF6179 domain-containing protein [Kineothrix sp. MB12-C1]|uniref:DUF6179 domain-containing protein n=1 Tax=Kineothrix sp. MB12-C1 TaxID=3070215 RepID=UPI0027D210C4|nr:DUF6179 domain-containing protein [Kineothrix sp. MB12-C1]WMC93037.1 DUF6179 domain-containing protein [Kineothrix sp. MB12-C1]
MDYKMEELLPVVKKLTDKYTSKASTSITYETAEQLMGAVLYCIKEREMAGDELGVDEVSVVKKDRVSAIEAYEAGYQAVLQKVKKTKELYDILIEDFDSYGNRALFDTVSQGMPEFFIHYDARFFPQDHILTLDYPLLDARKQKEKSGIDLIYKYLSCIATEQRFLKTFSKAYVLEVLREYHREYEELLINLPSIVLRSVIKRMLESHEEYRNQKVEIRWKNKKALEEEIRFLFHIFIQEEYGEREDDRLFLQEVKDYLSQDIPDFTAELAAALCPHSYM